MAPDARDPVVHDPIALLAETGATGADATTIVTHGAVIVLDGDRAWKLKRPVAYRYMDFSTADRRRHALQEELRLNRRTAPHLYRAVHAITRGADGTAILDGPGEPVDWVLEMTRFPDDALLARHADRGRLDDSLMTALAGQIVSLHHDAEVSADTAGAARLLDVVVGNRESMARYPEILDPARADELTDRLTTLIEARSALLDERAAAGRVRHGHGDLHLNNIALLDGVPVPFDCLEFDPEYAIADVLYDLAFTLMDLWGRGMRHEANVLANAYLDDSPDDESGFGLLPLMVAVRATVRAHVLAAAGDAGAARRYLELALTVVEPAPPLLVAIGGGSGTGKSTLARKLGGDCGAAPGARILRSDVLRKRLAGVSTLTRLPTTAYSSSMSALVYRELERLAGRDLADGMSVIADAVFGTADEQAAIRAQALAVGAQWRGIWLALPLDQRIARIAGRGPDASDATADVARAQDLSIAPPADGWTHLVADDDAVRAATALI
ncbi:bifunctional aminoglycoside phosphotransferase/ATP-binding protein [Gordonia crocea]|uniref:Kinase n=1 Tax=Gordonia crocea TaxID=589162 RepID=A0A7I9V135_9ACTN|nr:AAA family ATPase [Gordonia crocea]GED99115.1 kinase [Gordonia crocea]